MEADLILLPPRRRSGKESRTQGKSLRLETNLYMVSLKEDKLSTFLYQYSIETEPTIEDDMLPLFYRLLKGQHPTLVDKLGVLTHRGRMLWGSKCYEKVLRLEIPKNEAAKIPEDFVVLIKYTKTLDHSQICLLPQEERRRIFQVYTIALKEMIRRAGLKETVRNRFVRVT